MDSLRTAIEDALVADAERRLQEGPAEFVQRMQSAIQDVFTPQIGRILQKGEIQRELHEGLRLSVEEMAAQYQIVGYDVVTHKCTGEIVVHVHRVGEPVLLVKVVLNP